MEIVETGVLSALEQMQLDRKLIEQLVDLKEPLLRLWKWQTKTVTYGYFIDPSLYIDCNKAHDFGFEIARRPTGGGLLFHYHDFSFTVAIPSTHSSYSSVVLDNYQLINQVLMETIRELITSGACDISLVDVTTSQEPYRHLCMATPTKYDLVWQGKKIGGSAQRKTQYGFVHQSSLFLQLPCWDEISSFYIGSSLEIQAMKENSHALSTKTEKLQDRLSTLFARLLAQKLK